MGKIAACSSGASAPKKRRAEQDPGDHLAHHPRLAELHRRRSDQPGCEHHERDRHEEGGQRLGELALLGRGDALGRTGLRVDGEVQLAVLCLRLYLCSAAGLARDVAGEQAVAIGRLAGDALACLDRVARGVPLHGDLTAQAEGVGRQLVVTRDPGRNAGLLGARGRGVAHQRGTDRCVADPPEHAPAAGPRMEVGRRPSTQVTSPVSLPCSKRSAPPSSPAPSRETNWPDCLTSNSAPRHAGVAAW